MSTQTTKTIYLGILIVICTLFALPNLYGEQPGLQISQPSGTMTASEVTAIEQTLAKENIDVLETVTDGDQVNILFKDTDAQNQSQSLLRLHYPELKTSLNLFPLTPKWLSQIGAKPMKLGLDLRGGVHFLLSVNVDGLLTARHQADQRSMVDTLRSQNINYDSIQNINHVINLSFVETADLEQAQRLLAKEFLTYDIVKTGDLSLSATTRPAAVNRTIDYAVNQAMTILSNRVNELGVSEAIVHRQGSRNISVELPGIPRYQPSQRTVRKNGYTRLSPSV